MDAWQRAGQAIEELVAEVHDQDSENWAAIVPMADLPRGWGLELARWGTEATIIVERYSELIRMPVDVFACLHQTTIRARIRRSNTVKKCLLVCVDWLH
jgi:hypothetical protein